MLKSEYLFKAIGNTKKEYIQEAAPDFENPNGKSISDSAGTNNICPNIPENLEETPFSNSAHKRNRYYEKDISNNQSSGIFKNKEQVTSHGETLMRKRNYVIVASVACFVIAITGIMFSSTRYPDSVIITPSNVGDESTVLNKNNEENVPPILDKNHISNPNISEPKTHVSPPKISNDYTLVFNKAENMLSDAAPKMRISSHFWHDLSKKEIEVILPKLQSHYEISSRANFQKVEEEGELTHIVSYITLKEDSKAYLQIAPDNIQLCYLFPVEEVISTIKGIPVTAGIYRCESDIQSDIIYFANFTLYDIHYYVEFPGSEDDESIFTSLIAQIIDGGKTDLTILEDPIIPELKNEELSLKDAYADADFGRFLPDNVPKNFSFESSRRFINQDSNYLQTIWCKNMSDIWWSISYIKDEEKNRITSILDTINYDLSLYPIPHADSVPEDLRQIVNSPIFRIEELTLDAVMARAYQIEDNGDSKGYRMNFEVLYDDILVRISTKDVSPEKVFEMLIDLPIKERN